MLINELNNDIVAYLSIGAVILTTVVGIAFSFTKQKIKQK